MAHSGLGTAHEGIHKVVTRLKKSYYWVGMTRDVKIFVKTCPVCDKFKAYDIVPKAPLQPFRSGYKNEMIAMDVLGGQDVFPTTPRGNKLIL